MANPKLFKHTSPTQTLPAADTVNPAGGVAFSYPDWHKLCQLAVTGTFPDGTYYDDNAGATQLTELLELVAKLNDQERLAKLAIGAKLLGRMKDMPLALLCLLRNPLPAERERMEQLAKTTDAAQRKVLGELVAGLAEARSKLFKLAFWRVVRDAQAVKGFDQLLRSKQFGKG